ncbi:hypothetical protein DNTS_030458 [Danionella cerebrum]|uniref:Origin recognition complex subunit 3 n=1 Tax=Danionella cerebrum TaxID=2873325 RepID=A0A553MLX4_9TELE|nr:hypothetical protein DNTS_030458 [Danionella translucida]
MRAEMNETSATSSVSKGCFVFKSSKKRKRHEGAGGYFGESGSESFRICQELWETVQKNTEVIQDELNKKVLDSLVEFIRKHSFGSSSAEWRLRSSEIPTAALMLGVNVTDHGMTFRSLCNLLQDSLTPFVVSVHAKECSAHDSFKKSSSQIVQNNGSAQSLPVVVIFRDFEAFNPQVLQDFILICSRYIQELPFVLIFGIATSPSAVQQRLPHSVSSLLCIKVFQSLSCTQHLASVFEKLILDPQFPFKLSSRVLQVLVGIFLYHDFSVQNFVKGLQLSMLEHFSSQPLSVLCCQKHQAMLHVKTLSQQNVERVRHLPSFMRYVESSEETCQNLLKNLHKYHKNYYPALKCLHSLTSSLPKFPLGKQIRELHVSCNEKNIWEMKEYESAMQLLRILAKDELIGALERCAEILQSPCTKKMQKVMQQVQDFITRLQNLENVSSEDPSGDGVNTSKMELQRKTDLFQLQKANGVAETLLEKETRRTKKLSQFELLRSQVMDFIDGFVREYLTPAHLQPLSEVCYYSSSGTLRQRLNVTPRTSIQTALTHPFYYLQNEVLKTDSGTISSVAPDICIAYKLHLECGRLINLYDWLEAFATVLSATEDKGGNSEEPGQVDSMTHARFIQAVSELEFLGFIKSTKQKTDHVSRLTWGGC